jgi:hypothetical protein
MSLSLKASADGLSVDLKLGATVIATFSTSGVEAGTILADDAEAQGLTNALKLLTPDTLNMALKGANQSLAASGYQNLPGGLILQWGTGTYTSPQAVTFPIAFPNSAVNISGTADALSTGTPGEGFSYANLTTTGFNIYPYIGQSAGTNIVCKWIAFGY